jgi:hypothetical protein
MSNNKHGGAVAERPQAEMGNGRVSRAELIDLLNQDLARD